MSRRHRWSIWCSRSRREGWTNQRPWLGRCRRSHTFWPKTLMGIAPCCPRCSHCSITCFTCISRRTISHNQIWEPFLSDSARIWWRQFRSSGCFSEQTGSRLSHKPWQASRNSILPQLCSLKSFSVCIHLLFIPGVEFWLTSRLVWAMSQMAVSPCWRNR